ncbi:UPF0280 family protein [Paradesulfitobacterium ferrireducens]|uniref:UPF0280 family protein n=1 Tax=Paradesulfitobacterium ferrireducens TaxID=2816476 RepID=UPI001A905C9C|nr:UPF0280 family protein [Paradesulfitobacterium ferrireducens]
MDYRERTYRQQHRQLDLVHFQVMVKETDLDIGIRKDRFSEEMVHWVQSVIADVRRPLEEYLVRDPQFLTALTPHNVLPDAPPIAAMMAEAGRLAGVGPMAAVAGAVSELVGKRIAKRSRDVIVENGGDIFLRSSRKRYIGIFAGSSPLSNKIALEIRPEHTPLGICTSSGKIGHSLSFGQADAVVILSVSTALADAVATAAGNRVKDGTDLEKAIDFVSNIEGVQGAVIIWEDRLAVWGKVKLMPQTL